MNPSKYKYTSVLPYHFIQSGLQILLYNKSGELSFVCGKSNSGSLMHRDAAMLAASLLGISGKVHKFPLKGLTAPDDQKLQIFPMECLKYQDHVDGYIWLTW